MTIERLCTHYTIVPIVRVLRSLKASLRYAWGVRYAHGLCRAGGTVQRVIDVFKPKLIYLLKPCFLLATQARSILVAQRLILPIKNKLSLPKKTPLAAVLELPQSVGSRGSGINSILNRGTVTVNKKTSLYYHKILSFRLVHGIIYTS